MIILKKCHFPGRNDGIWPKNYEPLIESNLLTHFQSKSCTNLSESEFGQKNEHWNKNFLKIPCRRPKRRKFAKKMMILRRSPSRWPISNQKVWLISLKLNSGDKKKTTTETIIFIKIHFGGRNDGIWPKNDEPLTESYLLTHFQLKSFTNLSNTEFWHKKKQAPKRKVLKNAIS